MERTHAALGMVLAGRARGEGRGVHHKTIMAAAVEVRHRKHDNALNKRRNSRYAERVQLAVVPDRGPMRSAALSNSVVVPGTRIITNDWSGYAGLTQHGYDHAAIAERGDPEVAEEFMPIIHLVFSNLQAYLNESTFRFNRRFYPFNAFCSLVGIAGDVTAFAYAEFYAEKSRHTTSSSSRS